jgi:hypothetical protein
MAMHELCRFEYSKPAKMEDAFSTPEKPNDGTIMHELCRFAGLFPIGKPEKSKNSVEWNKMAIAWIPCGKVHHNKRRYVIHYSCT